MLWAWFEFRITEVFSLSFFIFVCFKFYLFLFYPILCFVDVEECVVGFISKLLSKKTS
jgi:hypothetical protein